MLLNQGDRVVFFGDSITQAHPGYVSFIGDMLKSLYAELQIEVINKGVGGDKVTSLLARVERDVIAEDPDVIPSMPVTSSEIINPLSRVRTTSSSSSMT